MRTRRGQGFCATTGLLLAALAVPLFFAPTYVALKAGNGSVGTCIEHELPAGYPVKDLDQPARATVDNIAGTLTCEWGPYRGQMYVSVFRLGPPGLRAASAATFGGGLCLAMLSVYGLIRGNTKTRQPATSADGSPVHP